ncbi:DUF1559 domain-containing protein [Blastopirellula marina]|uniref:DUF1559 domain-containing protein n=1 Tax=Blastopirellula marina TaxID=124 RepID=A0A2S8FI39_9BACT|nr:DUF1559 domain-containing protein [Blastopirellula marina]PQO31750.1 hypothetical protein C5Y98_20270 [Blastopirellula marina]PTL43057.1 DUF1559 domain-containing protein [Blastopirellula marina]
MEPNPYDSPHTASQEPVVPDKPWWNLTTVEWVVVAAIVVVLIGLLLPAQQTSCGGSQAMISSNKLKQIGLALHNYHDLYGVFPPAYVADEAGKPLYSWRVLILPFLEQEALYEQFDLAQTWDSDANVALVGEMPDVFASPYAYQRAFLGETSYLALVDLPKGRTVLRAGESRTFPEIPDGLSGTAMVVSRPDCFVIWTEPVDVDPLEFLVSAAEVKPTEKKPETVHVLLADGAVRRYIDASELTPLVFCDDGRVNAP